MQTRTAFRVSLLVGAISAAVCCLVGFRSTDGLWPGYDILALKSDVSQREVASFLADTGFRHVFSEVSQPYVFWDFDGMSAVPLVDIGTRFLPEDPRIAPYAEMIKGMYRGFGSGGTKTLFYLRSMDVSSGKLQTAKPMLDSVDSGWMLLKGGSGRFMPVFIIGIMVIFLANILFHRDNRPRNTLLALMPVVFSFWDPIIAVQAALAGFFFQTSDDIMGNTVIWFFRAPKNKRNFSFFLDMIVKNWKITCLVALPFFLASNNSILFISGIAVLCFQAAALCFSRLAFKTKGTSGVLPRFEPVTLKPLVYDFTSKERLRLASILSVLAVFCVSSLFFQSSIPVKNGGDLSIPLPHGYNTPGRSELPSSQSFFDHLDGQARLHFSRTDGTDLSGTYRDYQETAEGISIKTVPLERKIRIRREIPEDGIETLIKASCGFRSPVRSKYVRQSVSSDPLFGLIAAAAIVLLHISGKASIRRKATGRLANRGDGYDIERKLPESA